MVLSDLKRRKYHWRKEPKREHFQRLHEVVTYLSMTDFDPISPEDCRSFPPGVTRWLVGCDIIELISLVTVLLGGFVASLSCSKQGSGRKDLHRDKSLLEFCLPFPALQPLSLTLATLQSVFLYQPITQVVWSRSNGYSPKSNPKFLAGLDPARQQ